MSLHDWTRAPDNVFHTFHYGWLWNLAGLLNDGGLPAGFIARPEESLGPFESDVLTLDAGGAEAVPRGEEGVLRPVLTLSPPRLVLRKERRIAVYSARGERRVALIEVVSPGNKDSSRRAEHFLSKIVEAVESGIHVVVIDVLPPTGVARCFATEAARRLGAKESPSLGERYAGSFEVSLEPPSVSLYARELRLGKHLPVDVPLFLAPGERISLPLEESYEATFARLPSTDRALL